MEEAERIKRFLKRVMQKTHKQGVVIGWSGGIDSTVVLYLLSLSIDPKHIFILHLPFGVSYFDELIKIGSMLKIPSANICGISIKPMVKEVQKQLCINPGDKVRLGNIMARVRMITLFDFAKKTDSLVCGTENKTEHLLGYFTRYGDAASDIEPIQHLYKNQVYELASYLRVPKQIIQRKPSANLWEDQTDEGEFGFTYDEADEVLRLFFEKHLSLSEIVKQGFKHAPLIIARTKTNSFKHAVPYHIHSIL